jgi:hypothetical protein
MPRVFIPPTRKAGPGCVMGSYGKKETAKPKSLIDAMKESILGGNAAPKKYIGEDLLDFDYDENEPATPVPSHREIYKSRSKKSKSSSSAAASDAALSMTASIPSKNKEAYRALGFDTRCLQASCVDDFCSESVDFIRTLVRRGIGPSLVATTALSSNTTKTAISVDITSITAFLHGKGEPFVQPVSFAPKELDSTTAKAISVPKALSAKYSWKIFGEIVCSLVNEHQYSAYKRKGPAALDITLITTDLAFFCDTDHESHQKALGDFLNNAVPYVHEGHIASIYIVVAETGKLALRDMQDDEETMDLDDAELLSSYRTSQSLRMAKCLHVIQQEMEDRAATELSAGSAGVPNTRSLPVKIMVSGIDHCSIGYKMLSRQLIRNSQIGQSLRAQLVLELPKLSDGTQCSASLDASYHTLPFPVNSVGCKRLGQDMQCLSGCTLKLVKSLPHSSIDATLMYGVPIEVRSGFEADPSAARELEFLITCLFRRMDNESSVLLLSTSADKQFTAEETMFHMADEQFFILMPNATPSASQRSHQSGLLFRYARADDLLLEASTPSSAVMLLDHDTASQYEDYIQRAFEFVSASHDNPLHQDSFKTQN